MSGTSVAAEEGAGAEAATAAHGDDGVLSVGALQLVDGFGGEDGAGAAERVTERDGAAVGVDALHVALVRELPREHDRRERLVDLDDVDVVDGEAVVVEELLGRGDRAFEHEHRVTPDEA